MKHYVVLEVGCIECGEESEVLLVTTDELDAIDVYNDRSIVSMTLSSGETRTEGRLQLHCYED